MQWNVKPGNARHQTDTFSIMVSWIGYFVTWIFCSVMISFSGKLWGMQTNIIWIANHGWWNASKVGKPLERDSLEASAFLAQGFIVTSYNNVPNKMMGFILRWQSLDRDQPFLVLSVVLASSSGSCYFRFAFRLQKLWQWRCYDSILPLVNCPSLTQITRTSKR